MLRTLGDKLFCVEHIGVTTRQCAKTLDNVVKYDQDAFRRL